MLTPNDIADRLEELIREQFPGEEVYREQCPNEFTRPCTLIAMEESRGSVAMGANVVQLRPKFTLTTYVEADEAEHSHLEELHQRQMTLIGLLLPGYIKVADRAPKVRRLKFEGHYDFDTVTVTFEYTLDRRDFVSDEEQPNMETLHLKH